MISAVKLSLLLTVLSKVESNDNRWAYNPVERACGILQIRQPVIDDVNKYCLQSYELDDAYNPRNARNIAEKYLRLWCNAERQYSFEDAARMWNGGGHEGWWKLSTLPYWRKVEAELKRRGLDSRATLLDSRDTIEECPAPQIKLLPGGLYLRIPGTTAASSSRSDLAMSFHFDLNGNAATAPHSTSFTFTIRRNGFAHVLPPASPPPILRPAQIHGDGESFEIHWHDTR